MIELPRAAIMAGELAAEAEFFSFGTNDLTQATMGLSRDDAGKFLPAYIEAGILPKDPFVSLDQEGVGALVKMAIERGRKTKADIKLGICGEHGGDPASISFFQGVGLSYVSCSPFRVAVARLAAGQAALAGQSAGKEMAEQRLAHRKWDPQALPTGRASGDYWADALDLARDASGARGRAAGIVRWVLARGRGASGVDARDARRRAHAHRRDRRSTRDALPKAACRYTLRTTVTLGPRGARQRRCVLAVPFLPAHATPRANGRDAPSIEGCRRAATARRGRSGGPSTPRRRAASTPGAGHRGAAHVDAERGLDTPPVLTTKRNEARARFAFMCGFNDAAIVLALGFAGMAAYQYLVVRSWPTGGARPTGGSRWM